MSWSIQFAGHPTKVVEALQKHSDEVTGQSKIEFDDALPNLIALVNQCFVKDGVEGYSKPFVKIAASGSGMLGRKRLENDELGEFEEIARSVQVTIEPMYGVLE